MQNFGVVKLLGRQPLASLRMLKVNLPLRENCEDVSCGCHQSVSYMEEFGQYAVHGHSRFLRISVSG